MRESLLMLRRRAGLIAATAAANLILSSIATVPWSEAVESGSLTGFPDPDAAMLADGGMIFVEWLRVDGPALLGALQASLWLGALAGLLALLPAALLMLGLADAEKLSVARHGRRAFVLLPAFSLLFGGTLLCQVVLVALSVLLWGLCMGAAEPEAYPWLTLGLALLTLCAWALPSMLQDLTRAALVARGARVLDALSGSFKILALHPGRILTAYLVPAAAGWLVVAASLAITAKLALLSPRELAAWSSFGLHQTCVFLLVTLRAYWLHRALRLAGTAAPTPALAGRPSSWLPTPDDTRAGNAEPGDPSPDRGA